MCHLAFVRRTALLIPGLLALLLTSTASFTQTAPPTCTLTLDTTRGPAPLTVNATGSCQSSSGLASLTLDWGDGSQPVVVRENGQKQAGINASHTYTNNGNYTVTLTGQDFNQASGSASQPVTVDTPPTCTLSVDKNSGSAPVTVKATGDCTVPGGDISTAVLDWGDGTIVRQNNSCDGNSSSVSASHAYSTPGNYTVSYTGNDCLGGTGSASQRVVVQPSQPPPPPQNGDVYVSGGNGAVERYSSTGALLQILDTGTTDQFLTGSGFDKSGNFYVTDFSAATVYRFDSNGNLLGQFGSGYSVSPESIVFDASGNSYIGQVNGTNEVLKLDSSGNVLENYAAAVENRGTDWVELAADQCTLYYTSEGTSIKRFDVCKKTQITPDLVTGLPGSAAFAMRVRPNGEFMVADNEQILRLDSSGKIIQQYTAPNNQCWFALNLDPDGTSFWSADLCNNSVYHFDILTGNVITSFTSSGPSTAGLSIRGEIRVAVDSTPKCNLMPANAQGPSPFSVSFSGSCTDAGNDISSGNSKATLNFGDGTSQSVSTANAGNFSNISHVYQNSATATYSVTDDGGRSTAATSTITVTQNQPPNCTFSVAPNNGVAPLTVNAAASCSDPENDINSAFVDWGDGTAHTDLSCEGSCGFRGSHQYQLAGTYKPTVTATDTAGNSFQTAVTPQTTITVVDSTPVCSLTTDKAPSNTGQVPFTVVFSGTCTDAGNDLGEGGSATLDFGDNTPPQQISVFNGGGNFNNVSHTYQTAGSFTATYTVTDARGLTTVASAAITATAPQAPTCTLTLDKNAGPPGTTISATGSCTETTNNGGFGSVSIDFGDSSAPSTSTGDGQATLSQTATHQYNAPGNFTVTVTGTDNDGQTGTATKPVTITQNSTPTCGALTIAPNSGNVPLTVTIMATCTDANQDLTSSVLDFGDGQVKNNTLDGQSQTISTNTQHTYTAPGSFTVTFTAPDAQGLKGTTSNTVTASSPPPPNLPPTCTLTVEAGTGLASLTVTATGNCTDPENDIVSTSLDFGDGTVQTATSGDHTYAKPGTSTITVRATDRGELSGSASQTITLSAVNSAPTCTLVVTPTSGTVPLAVTATGSCTDAENNITTTVLDFGDGPVTNGSNGSHTYNAANVYTVKLTATDAGGLAGSATQTVTATLSAFPVGVFLGLSPGALNRYGTDGALLKAVSTGLGGTVAGMAFDKAGNIYAADFTAGNISKFDDSGNLLGTFGSGYNCQPESLAFDGAGNLYVGQQGCSRNILKFDSSGKLLDQFTVTAEEQGSDDIDLSADQCTMLYTSEGPSILRYDVCKKQQLTPFATGLKKALVPRILPDGGVIVTDLVDILRLDSSGKTITTYTAPGEQCWYPLTLDQDGKSFWAADYCSSNIYQFDIASGKQLGKFNSGTASGTIFGIARAGTGLNVAGMGSGGSMTASPATATLSAGQSKTFTVTFTVNQSAVGQTFQLSCAGLPAGFSCAFSPSSITPASTAPVTAQLTITSTVTHASLHVITSWAFASWLALFPAVVLTGIGPRGRNKRKRGSLLVLMFVVMAAFTSISCGGKNQMTNTVTAAPQGSYNVIVVGHSAQSQASTTVNLTVQ